MSYRMSEPVIIEAIHGNMSDTPDYLRPVLDYGHDLRGDRIAPGWSDFDLLALPAKSLSTTQVLDWLPEENMFRFRYCGSGYGLIYGHDLTGKTLMDIPFRPLADFLRAEYLSVIQGQKANLITYGYYSKGAFIELETRLRLPLSDNGCSITGIAPVDVTIGGVQMRVTHFMI